jgi:hypothetical protein
MKDFDACIPVDGGIGRNIYIGNFKEVLKQFQEYLK